MKTPTAGLNATLTQFAARQGFLARIVLNNSVDPLLRSVLYLCSLNDGFSFRVDGVLRVWDATDLVITGIGWTPGGGTNPKMSIGDSALVWWAYATGGSLQDALVDVWLCYSGATLEAEPLLRGRIGNIRKGEMTIDCDIVLDGTLKSSPRRRVQNVIAPQFLLAPGTKILIGSDTWTLDRK